PQLQQAIKLLQLSRMELVDLVREEMMENPGLEDDIESQSELAPDAPQAKEESQLQGETELNAQSTEARDQAQEVTGDAGGESQAANEIDWDNYLQDYSQNGPTAPSYKASNDELPTLESTLSKKTSLDEHLAGQLKMSKMPMLEENIGMLIIGNLDQDGYLKEPP